MLLRNVHRRRIDADPTSVGRLIDTLASKDDRLWPHAFWPRMHFAGGLRAGSHGGHGPIRYSVEEHAPGQAIVFRFSGDGPPGLTGLHRYRVLVDGKLYGLSRVSWPLMFRPLHDALIEDSLDIAQQQATGQAPPRPARWSRRVRLLRWAAQRLR